MKNKISATTVADNSLRNFSRGKTVSQKPLLRNWQRLTVLLLVILAVSSVVIFNAFVQYKFYIYDQNFIKNNGVIKPTAAADDVPAYFIRRQLDGVYVEPAQANNFPIAVMIDNDPHARPQGGLASANLVYEAKVESNITRYLAFFSELNNIEKIGPVRSARPYFIDWSQGMGALYVHVGGSQQALAKIVEKNILNVDEYYNEQYFLRSNNKLAPHNVYTTGELMASYLQLLSVNKPKYASWKYKDDLKLLNRPETQKIEINYGVFNFQVAWIYDKEKNKYTRQQAGIIYKDLDDKIVEAKNIIIIYVDSKVIDTELRREMTTIGSGKAIYCFDGSCNNGVWRKNDSTDREKIYDVNNAEVQFNAGTTWVQVVQDDVDLVF